MKEKLMFVLVVFCLITAPALAGGPVNVFDESGFGSLIDSKSSSSTGPLGFTLSIEARVWLKDGTYTYVYEITDNGTSPFGISSVGIGSSSFDGLNLNWGTVGGPALLSAATFSDNLTFHFSPALPSGNTTIVYAQSTQGPLEYLFGGTGYGPSGSGNTLGPGAPPLATPEPGTLILLGTGLLGGVGFLRKKLGL